MHEGNLVFPSCIQLFYDSSFSPTWRNMVDALRNYGESQLTAKLEAKNCTMSSLCDMLLEFTMQYNMALPVKMSVSVTRLANRH